eukprot:CAMPEP_0183340048 /NCGR_PEP_ID=MMETSP0164_2-20130417/6736_1 /TAXON_ID=221442 /ORGANISM="Coccolithus pelagicus ssp braarudi, Strain PLY182g" /LENGTH=78 /DNA_ID=CAMNT_0025510125 /DNA_START=134 /DNA_END=366 /DNA_ORIENTATION=+
MNYEGMCRAMLFNLAWHVSRTGHLRWSAGMALGSAVRTDKALDRLPHPFPPPTLPTDTSEGVDPHLWQRATDATDARA